MIRIIKMRLCQNCLLVFLQTSIMLRLKNTQFLNSRKFTLYYVSLRHVSCWVLKAN